MKKHTLFFTGMLAVALAFGLVLVGCEDANSGGGGGGEDTAILGTWNPDAGNTPLKYILKFETGGKLTQTVGTSSSFTYTANGSTLKVQSASASTWDGTCTYKIEGSKLTITSGSGNCTLYNGIYTK
jgi:hypothetical protein